MSDNNAILSIESIKTQLLPIIEKYQIKSVSIFGSYARNEASPSSDIDLIIDGGNYKGLEFIDLINEVEAALGRNVDVITESTLLKAKTRGELYFQETVEKERVKLI